LRHTNGIRHKALFADDFEVTVAALVVGHITAQNVWLAGGSPHWLPPRWATAVAAAAAAANSESTAAIKLSLVGISPRLAALAARINSAYALFESLRSAPNTNTHWLQSLRHFMNSHCPLVSFIERHGIGSDAELHRHCLPVLHSQTWHDIVPSGAHIHSERFLPRALLSVLRLLDLWYKRPMSKAQNNCFVHILCKALPQPGQKRAFQTIVGNYMRSSESFYRTIIYIIFCSMLGTYHHAARECYRFQTQTRIWQMMTESTRGKLTAFFSAKRQAMFVTYALREYFIYAVEELPALENCIAVHYAWADFCNNVRVDMYRVRRCLSEEIGGGGGGGGGGGENPAMAERAMWSLFSEYLTRRHKDHTLDKHTVKMRISEIIPHFSTYARTLRPKSHRSDMARISRAVWLRVCTYMTGAAQQTGVAIAPLAALGMCARGMRIVRNIVARYRAGDIINHKTLAALSPASFELFHAYLIAYQHLHSFVRVAHAAYICNAQRRAIRYRYGVLGADRMPDEAGRVAFCESCVRFNHVIVDNENMTRSNGPDSIIYDFARQRTHCKREPKDKLCLAPLYALNAFGQVLCVKQKNYSLCCACTSLHLLDMSVTVGGLPVCGFCNAVDLMRAAGTLPAAPVVRL
jgi:hypothetical protein